MFASARVALLSFFFHPQDEAKKYQTAEEPVNLFGQ